MSHLADAFVFQVVGISQQLEDVIEDLSNSRDKQTIHLLNQYPVLATHAHTRPFRRRWLNAVTGIILPVGIFIYFRMLRFRLRLHRDLKTIEKTNQEIIGNIGQLVTVASAPAVSGYSGNANETNDPES